MPTILQAFVSCHGLWEAAIIEQCDSMPIVLPTCRGASRDEAHGTFHGTMGRSSNPVVGRSILIIGRNILFEIFRCSSIFRAENWHRSEFYHDPV